MRIKSSGVRGVSLCLIIVSMALSSIIVSACGGGGGGGDSSPAALSVVSTTPDDGETDVDVAATVQIVFNTPIDPATLESEDAGSFTDSLGNDVDLEVSLSSDAKTLILTPKETLEYGETYTGTLYAGVIKNTSGSALTEDVSFSFTTEDQPEAFDVSTRSPDANQTNVSISTTIDITFNMPLDESTVTSSSFYLTKNGGSTITGEITFLSSYIARITPSATLDYNATYTVHLTSGIQNHLGEPLSSQTYSFTTALDPDALTVDSTSPVSDAEDVGVASAITINFNQDIDYNTVNNTTFIVKPHGSASAISGNYNTNGSTARFIPTAPGLNYSTQYDVTITTGLKSGEGHSLSVDYEFSFTTVAQPSTFYVSANVPAEDATDVSVNTAVIITFNMAVNTSTVINGDTFSLTAEGSTDPVEGAITYSNSNTIMTFTPAAPLSTDTSYTVVLTTGISSAIGSLSLIAKTYDFTTSSAAHNSGDPDTSFGTSGLVRTTIGNYAQSSGLLLQASGNIVLGGYSYDNDTTSYYLTLARYLINGGDIDITFGSSGTVATEIPDSKYIEVMEMGLQGTSVIAAGNWADDDDNNMPLLARYSSDGVLDTTFGTDGLIIEPYSSNLGELQDMAVLSSNKILGAGVDFSGALVKGYLVRYTADGARDASFGTNGVVTTSYGSHNYASICLAVQSDGKIVTGGVYTDDMNTFYYILARHNADGSMDTSFGTDGFAPMGVSFTGSDQMSYDIAIQDDGKILATGKISNGTNLIFALARFNGDGSVDTGFGNNGYTGIPIGTGDAQSCSLAIQSDGKIVLLGYAMSGTDYMLALARFDEDGEIDTTFGTNGTVTMDAGMGSSSYRRFKVMIQPSDGKIVVSTRDNGDFAVARFWP